MVKLYTILFIPFYFVLNYLNYARHIDAALYNLNPPKVTTLQALKVPKGEKQTVRYEDGTGDELQVPLGTTACKCSIYRFLLKNVLKYFIYTISCVWKKNFRSSPA